MKSRRVPSASIPALRQGGNSLRSGGARGLLVPTEHQEQAEVVAWAELHKGRWPELALLFAIPNFSGRLGHLTVRHSVKLSREGRKAGVPDLCLPVPRQGKHGLYIEMKRQRGGTVSAEQRAWHIALRDVGHRVEVCKGAAAAIEVLTDYLGKGTAGGKE